MIAQDLDFLSQRGLNLVAVLDCTDLPQDVTMPMQKAGVALADFRRLVLLGNAGPDFWAALKSHGFETADPVDHFSLRTIEELIERFLGDPAALVLYPQTAYAIPLQQLGTLAGWHHPSPLGLSIHPSYGLWSAYRAAFLTRLPLALRTQASAPSPCATCRDQPCRGACPAGAVRGLGEFDIPGCGDHRLAANSPCADRCLARLACPVGVEHCYSMEQLGYHYEHSLQTIRRYRKSISGA